MELKGGWTNICKNEEERLNCTFMELKERVIGTPFLVLRVLIVPLWN